MGKQAPRTACADNIKDAVEAVYHILVGDTQPQDEGLIEQIFAFWNVADVDALRNLGIEGFVPDEFERTRLFGELACLVTDAAWNACPLARSVCDKAATALSMGIRLVGACFRENRVLVALIGGAVRSIYMQQAMTNELARSRNRVYEIVEPVFPNAVGAILMAFNQHRIVVTESVLSTIRSTTLS